MTPLWFCLTLHISLDLNYVWHTGLYQGRVFIIMSILIIIIIYSIISI